MNSRIWVLPLLQVLSNQMISKNQTSQINGPLDIQYFTVTKTS